MKKCIAAALLAFCAAACGGSSPSAPSSSTPTTTTTAATGPWTLSGTITSAAGGGIAGATITILDGPNAGQSARTDSAGAYSILLNQAGFTASVAAAGFVTTTRAVTLTANTTVSLSLLPSQVFTKSGSGNTVFDMPTYITRVRIIGDFSGFCQNFIASIGGRGVVNEILGTCSVATTGTHYDAVALTTGGVVSITNASGISWSFTEVR